MSLSPRRIESRAATARAEHAMLKLVADRSIVVSDGRYNAEPSQNYIHHSLQREVNRTQHAGLKTKALQPPNEKIQLVVNITQVTAG